MEIGRGCFSTQSTPPESATDISCMSVKLMFLQCQDVVAPFVRISFLPVIKLDLFDQSLLSLEEISNSTGLNINSILCGAISAEPL